MEKSVLYVVNPISGDKDKSKSTDNVVEYAKQKGFETEVYETTGSNDEEAIREKLEQGNYDRLLAAGGDGTIKMVAELLFDFPSVGLAILPAGSANGLAKSLRIPEKEKEALAIAFADHFIEMDVVELNDEVCLHLSDAGFNAEMIHNYEQDDTRGFLGYAKGIFKTMTDYSGSIEFTITENDNEHEHEARMVVFGNASEYGFGGKINPEGDVTDGNLDIVVVKSMGLEQMVKMMTGASIEQYDTDDVELYKVEKATIRFHEPAHFQIDGEYKGKIDEVALRIYDSKCKVYVPEEFHQKEN